MSTQLERNVNHTPIPWRRYELFDRIKIQGKRARNKRWQDVAEVIYTDHPNQCFAIKEQIGNATILEAAPYLYITLSALVDELLNRGYGNEEIGELKRAREALAIVEEKGAR